MKFKLNLRSIAVGLSASLFWTPNFAKSEFAAAPCDLIAKTYLGLRDLGEIHRTNPTFVTGGFFKIERSGIPNFKFTTRNHETLYGRNPLNPDSQVKAVWRLELSAHSLIPSFEIRDSKIKLAEGKNPEGDYLKFFLFQVEGKLCRFQSAHFSFSDWAKSIQEKISVEVTAQRCISKTKSLSRAQQALCKEVSELMTEPPPGPNQKKSAKMTIAVPTQ